jgi:hypothetical protein
MAAALPLVGLALTVGAAGAQYASAQSTNNARKRAQNQWMQYQKQKARVQGAKDEENRRKADAARNEGLNKMADAQGTVDAETQRLTEDLGAGDTLPTAPEATVNDQLLSGQGTNPDYKNYVAGKIAEAAKSARNKTAALAAMQAYTGGQFGLQRTNQNTIRNTGDAIDMFNNMRRGDLSIYGMAKGVSPKVVNPSGVEGLGTAMASIGGNLMGGGMGGQPLGQSLSTMF